MRARVSCVATLVAVAVVALTGTSCGAGGGDGFGSTDLVQLVTTSIPAGSTGAAYDVQFVAVFPHPPGKYLIKGGSLPPGLKLNQGTGLVTGYPRQAGRFTFRIGARDGSDPGIPQQRDATFAEDARTFTADIAVGPPNILPQTLPPAQYRASYGYVIDVVGGTAPYLFAQTGGTLPVGLAVSPDGQIGTFPTQAQQAPYEFDVTVTDANGLQDTATLSLQVVVPPLIILTAQVQEGALGFPYDVTMALASAGAGAPITWSQVAPEPGEVLLSSFDMEITTAGHLRAKAPATGPTSLGSHRFTLQVTDEAGQLAARAYDLVVNPGPVLTGISPDRAAKPGPFTATGLNFQPGAQLLFKPGPNQTVVTPTFVNATTLTFATAPATPLGGGGAVAVEVLNPDGGNFTLQNAFNFPAAVLSLGTKGFISSGVSSTGLDAADVDGDGRADVVHCGASGFINYWGGATSTAGGLLLHMNQGGSPPTFSSTSLASGNFYGVRFVDLNADGRLDVVALGSTTVRTWLNGVSGNPLGTFTAGPSSSMPSMSTYPQDMAIGFLNGDSVPDLVFGEAYAYYEPDGSVYSMLGNGSGGFTILDSATSSISGIFGAVTVECLDVNGDGRSDVVAGLGCDMNGTTSTLYFLSLTQANGTFGPWAARGTPGGAFGWGYSDTTGLRAGDFLGNGTPAFVLSHNQDVNDGGARLVALLSGSSLGQTDLQTPSGPPKQIGAIDLDFDAKMDWAVSLDPSSVAVYRGSTQTIATTVNVTSGSPSVGIARTGRIAGGDLDGDGKQDLLVTTSYWAADPQPDYYGSYYAMNLAGNGSPMGVVFYLNTSN